MCMYEALMQLLQKYWETCNCEGVNIIGPWIDVWAFGVLLIDELRGRADKCSIISEVSISC